MTTLIVSLALLIPALAILIVALVKTIGAEDRSQRTYQKPEERFKYHHGRTYDYPQAVQAKYRAKVRAIQKRKQAVQRVVQLADAKRKAAQ